MLESEGSRFSPSVLRERKISPRTPDYKSMMKKAGFGKVSTPTGSRKASTQRDSASIAKQPGNMVRKPKVPLHTYASNYPKQIRKSQLPGFSLGPRIPTKVVDEGPAPNSYNLPSCFDVKKGPLITGRPKTPISDRTKNPGPCQYSLPEVKQYKKSATCSAVYNPSSKAPPATKPRASAPKYYASPPLTGSKLAAYIRSPRK